MIKPRLTTGRVIELLKGVGKSVETQRNTGELLNELFDDFEEFDGTLNKDKMENLKTPTLKVGEHTKAWSASNDFCGVLIAYCVQKYFEEIASDHLALEVRGYREIVDANFVSHSVITEGVIIYTVDNKLVQYNAKFNTHHIKCNTDLTNIINGINNIIKTKNPLIGGHFNFENSSIYGYQFTPKKTENITSADVIIDDDIKEDIMDNTVFHIENIDMNNGVIFFGDPGTGKTLMTTAIVNEAKRKGGIASFMYSQRPPFSLVEEINSLFLDKSIHIFEDIDSYGESRDTMPNPYLSEFLQFLNGISSKQERSIYIATTNHVERLDKAISNRPIRFNRLYEFPIPDKEQLDSILAKLFKDNDCEKYFEQCHNKGFTGAHLKDIQRSCQLLSKKKEVSIKDVFLESLNKTNRTFGLKSKNTGFNS